MKNREVIVLLCSLLALQSAVSANVIAPQSAGKSGSGNSRSRIRNGQIRAVTGGRPAEVQKASSLNPLVKNSGLQNVSLLDANASQKQLDKTTNMQAFSDNSDSSDDADKDSKRSEKTWEQKLQEASTGEIPKNISEAAERCSKTVAKNWNSWTDGTGVLTIKKIGQLLKNPDITGPQAAALGALADYFYRQDRKVSSVKVADSKDSYTLKEIQTALSDLTGNGRTNEALADDYRTALIQIKDDTTKDGYSLYGKLGSPCFGENVQWNVCDCYFVSAVNAVLQHDPSAIAKMIKQVSPDKFEVTFPGYKDGQTPITVRLTQGDIAMFSHTRDGGCYLAVLGRAADKVMREEHDDHSSAGNATPLGTMVDQGSHWDETNTFHLMTGKNYVQIPTKHYTTEELKNLIDYALKHREIVGLGEAYSPISKHYLLITGFHDGMVDVLNPWGQTRYYSPLGSDPLPFLPDMVKPDSGHVFTMRKGHFEVPLKDMVKWGFGSLTFQRKDLLSVLGPESDSSGDDKKSTDGKQDASAKSDEKKSTDGKQDASAKSDDKKSTDGKQDASAKSDDKKSGDDRERKDTKSVQAPMNNDVAKKEFDRTVQKYWDKWTADSDGKLNIKQIGSLLRDVNIKGKEAAVLGTLAITLSHDVINKEHKPLATFTEAQVLSNSRDADAVKYFKDAMGQLQGDTSSRGLSLFGKTGHPDWKEVKQWKVGDCWFVSVVDAVLRRYGPDYVEKMITQDPNDPSRFSVKFPGYDKAIEVTLTEGEISMFSHTMNDGSWLAVLGMALNNVVEQEREAEKKPEGYRSWYPFGHVVNGGNNLTTYKLFTNKTYTRISTNNLSEMKAALKWAEDHQDPIGINTHVHDLSIKKIDWQAGKVEIQNPWGTRQVYTTDIKIKMGPDGTFWIPLDELYNDSFIKIEVPVEAKRATESQRDGSKENDASSGISANPQTTATDLKPSSATTSATTSTTTSATTSATKSTSTSATEPDSSARNVAPVRVNGVGDLASQAEKESRVERLRFNELLENFLYREEQSGLSKQMVTALQEAVKNSRDLEDKLIQCLCSSPNIDKVNLSDLRSSVQQSRASVNKLLANLDAKYSSDIKDAITDERHLMDRELESLTKMSEDFSSGSKVTQLNPGSALIAHTNALSLRSSNATINLSAGAVAFVVNLNGSTAVYNLGNDNTIKVDPGTGDSLLVQSGHALLLACNLQATAEQANPLPNVPLRVDKTLGLYNKNSCFDAVFPYTTLMDSAPQIAPLFQSKSLQDKQLVNALLKRAAAAQVAGD